MSLIYVGSDFRVTWTGATGTTAAGVTTPLNAATITYTLADSTGETVSGGTGTLAYLAGSSGDYAAVIEDAVTSLLTPGSTYTLDLVLVEGEFDDARRLTLRAARRGPT